MFTVYAIYNQTADTYYIGNTSDLSARLDAHNNHTLGGYTARFEGEWDLIYYESVPTRTEALLRERQLKSYRGREFIKTHIPH
jgi:putative endonuclease